MKGDPHPIALFGLIASCLFGTVYADNHFFYMARPAIYVVYEVADAPTEVWVITSVIIFLAAEHMGTKDRQRRNRDRQK